MNKQELEKLPDYDLNNILANLLGLDIYSRIGNEVGVYCKASGARSSMKNYCNVPSDIMPEVFKRRISLDFNQDHDSYIAESFHFYSGSAQKSLKFYSWNDNPLRAAVIVVILMEEDRGNK